MPSDCISLSHLRHNDGAILDRRYGDIDQSSKMKGLWLCGTLPPGLYEMVAAACAALGVDVQSVKSSGDGDPFG